MTVIEFFDRESAIENIISTLLCEPQKVVFIGNSPKMMKKSIERYKAVAYGRGLEVEFEAKSVPKNNLTAAVDVIEETISQNKDCVVDLSGGNDLCLVALGTVYAKHRDSVKLHRFNLSDGSMVDCDCDGVVCDSKPMKLSINECILLYGGRIKCGGKTAYEWNFSEDFKNDIRLMWSLCRKNPTEWNTRIKLLNKLCSEYSAENSLFYSFESGRLKKYTEKAEEGLIDTLRSLANLKIINRFVSDGSAVEFAFKNEQVKRALSKSGQVLELVVTAAALESTDKNGKRVYDEVLTGVEIDWEDEKSAVSNEIDVLLMRGITPVFVSCKNGAVSSDELYKLSTVAKKFGGRFAKKVLVATELEKLGSKEGYIKARAESLGIKIIDKADVLSDKELQRKINNLYI